MHPSLASSTAHTKARRAPRAALLFSTNAMSRPRTIELETQQTISTYVWCSSSTKQLSSLFSGNASPPSGLGREQQPQSHTAADATEKPEFLGGRSASPLTSGGRIVCCWCCSCRRRQVQTASFANQRNPRGVCHVQSSVACLLALFVCLCRPCSAVGASMSHEGLELSVGGIVGDSRT